MKKVVRYQTVDGFLYVTHRDAQNHAEDRYSEALAVLSRALSTADGKYYKILEILDKSHAYMENILKLSADRELEADDAE